ncbi:ribosome 60S biogenesis N-terminal-domain-containing protein [Mycena sp. CBHHK59/15]|nr:ribosome 60S biogenesis N-terminal-domain-containing protein [Mycena sp. CBHHK59/15]
MPELPTKRLKSSKARKFASPDEIRASLRSQNHDDLIQALTELRNQFSVWPNEESISTQDARLLLAQRWLDVDPGAHDVFTIWETANPRQPAPMVLILSLLSSLLVLLSSHYTFHMAGHPILRTLLTPLWMRKLNSYLGGAHTELLLVTLKLFNTMSVFGGGRERKTILESFAWETKSLPKLLNMRRKAAKSGEPSDPIAKPDIRTLYMFFCLSFVDPESPTQLKTMFLEQHKDAFFSIFRGLAQDSLLVIRKVLEICWTGIWSDPKIKRTLKIGLFSEITVAQLIKIYDRVSPEDDDPEHVPADLVHHFLLAICTRPGVGICFKDRGWYPRKSETDIVPDDEDLRTHNKGGKIYNKILANILKTLKVNEDLRQQELALKIMAACPELVASYWSAAGLTLEPRLSSKWIANISFFGTVLSLPVPTDSFLISDNSALYHPTPPPLSAVLENILPSVNTKAHLSKGLLQSSGLVQHCTALALCKCLAKYQRVSQVFRSIETALEEDEGDGQWAKLRRDMDREIRHRVPEFQVIVAFASAQRGTSGGAVGKAIPHPTRTALLAESAQRLLRMYHSYLPLVVAETRFDVGKLVQNFSEIAGNLSGPRDSGEESRDATARLNIVRQLHVLRLLNDSDQFVWSGKTASSPRSHLHVLLDTLAVTDIPALRWTLNQLIIHLLSESLIFQQNQEEPSLWLSSLPTARSPNDGGETPEGISLTGEAATVIRFLDDCVQRCLKTPYRYIEEMQALYRPENQQSSRDELPSSLLMTALEQLGAKMASKLLSPSDILALATFLRKLVFHLSTIQHDLSFLHQIAAKINRILAPDLLFPQNPVTSDAILRQVEITRSCLMHTHLRRDSSAPDNSYPRLGDFLRRVGDRPIPDEMVARIKTAFEVVDWVRIIGPLSPIEIRTSADIVARFHPPALKDLAESLDPDQKLLWDGLNVVQDFLRLRHQLSFDWIFLHATVTHITDDQCREILANAAFTNVPTLADLKRMVCLINHSLSASRDVPKLMSGLLLLLAAISRRSSLNLSSADFTDLKEQIFLHSGVMVGLCTSSSLAEVYAGLHRFLESVLDPTKDGDRRVTSHISNHWLSVLMNSNSEEAIPFPAASSWIPYMEPHDLFGLLQFFGNNSSNSDLLEMIIAALATAVKADSIVDLHPRLYQLIALRSLLPKSLILERMIALVINACLPVALAGRTSEFAEETPSPILMQCNTAWSLRLHRLPESLDLQNFLFQEQPWSASTVTIVLAILYQSGCPPETFSPWLTTDFAARRSVSHLSQVLRAYLDVLDPQSGVVLDADDLIPHLSRFLVSVTDESAPTAIRIDCAACIRLAVAHIPRTLSGLLAAMVDRIGNLRDTSLTVELLTVGISFSRSSDAARPMITSLVDHALQWCIRAFGTPDIDTVTQTVVDKLVMLVETSGVVKAHQAETLLSVIVQNRLSDISAIALLTAILRSVPLKPLVVNRYLQSIVQHPHFYKVCGTNAHRSALRDAVIYALHVLFNLHPANTCQVTHVQPLVPVYRGTVSTSDRKLLSIFQLFEFQRKVSVASLLGQWSSTPDVPSTNVLEAVQGLDAILVLRTCLHFPKWRSLEDQPDSTANLRNTQIYDPVFLILIFAQAMAEKIPENAFGWIELFRTNIVSLLIRALSAKDQRIRDVARLQLAALWTHLEASCITHPCYSFSADMQEQPHVVYVLNILRNLLTSPTAGPLRRLPSYTTLILLHALRGIFYPSNFVYPLTARFLLQRPTLDMTDVPMLYGMLYSSSDDWKKERGWIIRFLADGMMSTDDWRVLKRRHTWDLLASLFQSSEDIPLRNGILEVLANLTCNAQATTSLVLKSSLLYWIEIQLLKSTVEALAWIKILENILLIADASKMESCTGGEWRFVVCRCLSLILESTARRSSKPGPVFALASPVILRLSLLPGPSPPGLPMLLNYSLQGLQLMENELEIPHSRMKISPSASVQDLPPHCGQDVQVIGDQDPLLMWGKSLEYLWQACMTLAKKPPVWDALTSRLLIWRSVVGEEDTDVGEWARKETLQNLRLRIHTV